MKKITIINAYGDKNIGDAAILNVGISLINEAFKNDCIISVLCENRNSLSKFVNKSNKILPFQLPYGYAIRNKIKKVSYIKKFFRLLEIYILSSYYIFRNKTFRLSLPKKGFYSYISAIAEADKVIGMGGGYLTTNDKYKDYFGLLLTLLPIYIAKIYKKHMLILPMSFGPFASTLQRKLTFYIIKKMTILARDEITLKELRKLDSNKELHIFYAPDLALFYNNLEPNTHVKLKSNYIVLTAREWFKNKFKQSEYENTLVIFINTIWKDFGIKTIFVPMARNIIEDDDNRVAKRLLKSIIYKQSFLIYNPSSLNDLQKLISEAKFAVCTRMHSAILSMTVKTPFIAIGYTHKTLGLIQELKLKEWYIDINNISSDGLLDKYNKLCLLENYQNSIENYARYLSQIIPYRGYIVKKIQNINNQL